MRKLILPVLFALLVWSATGIAQVSRPTTGGVSTGCGESGVDANGNCLPGVSSGGVSSGSNTPAGPLTPCGNGTLDFSDGCNLVFYMTTVAP